jgi:hypothetical protein
MFEMMNPKVCLWSGEDNTSPSIEPAPEKKMGRRSTVILTKQWHWKKPEVQLAFSQ